MYQEKKINKDIPIILIKDEKFNEIVLSLRLLLPLDKTTVTQANIMVELFEDRLEKYPTKKSMTKLTDELYGLRIEARTYSVGALLVMDLSLIGINERFVEDGLHLIYMNTLMEVLKTPLINESTVKEAVKNVRQNLLRIDEQPSTYAIFNAFEKAGKEQLFGVNVFGYEDDLELITVESMKEFHRFCVEEVSKEIYLAGDVEDLEFNVDLNYKTPISPLHKTIINPEIITEDSDANQSEIVQVYQVDIDPNHELYYAYLTFLAILGQSPSSYLFQNIREKNSLCYSIYASQLIYDGLFYIATSVRLDKEEVVIDLIKEQFNLIKQDVLDLESTKRYLKNRIDGTSETTRALMDFAFRNIRLESNETPQSMINKFNDVTLDEVKEVLNHIKEPFTFIYKGVSDETNN